MNKKEFFEYLNSQHKAVTFNEVRLKTSHSEVMPREVSLKTKFSRNIELKIPIVSAAMDSVTEHELAIELAKLGGIGIIHKNLTPEDQAHEVARVKLHLNGLIEKPICVYEDETIKEILKKKEEKKYSFHTFPVLNREEKLVGILTRDSFDFCENESEIAGQIMRKQLLTAPEGTTIEQAYEIMKKEEKKSLPLVNEERKLVGMYAWSDIKRIKSTSFSSYNLDENGRLRVGAAIGVKEDAFARLKELVKKNVDVVVIDTAHGDSKAVLETLKEIKQTYLNLDVVVGNISEPESAKRLIEAGADGIKIGQGPGSICTTRIVAGIGCPQVTAVYNCALVADEYGIPVCADGGLVNSGDITLAIGAGAHSVMLGSMLAGTKESPGEIVFYQGRQWKNYRGMGSIGAMESGKGARERYNQISIEKSKLVPEGIEGLVPYKGELAFVITQYIGGLRSGMGYVGASTIQELREKSDFHLISEAGLSESHPHDVLITKEAPNYQGGTNN